MPDLSTYFTPLDFEKYKREDPGTIVVIDILRATTTICHALHFGIKSVLPVATLEEAREMKAQGILVAGERNGQQLSFADYGNTIFDFDENLKGKPLCLTTSNGTRTIHLASKTGKVLCGSFANFSVLAEYLQSKSEDVSLLCSGWLGQFSMEDALFAGALATKLAQLNFKVLDDESRFSMKVWEQTKNDLSTTITSTQHARRLIKMRREKDLKVAALIDSAPVVPLLVETHLVNIL